MRILVVKLADLGDLLLTEPALRSLRLGHPDARIDVLTTPHAAAILPGIAPWAEAITFEKTLFDVPGIGAASSAWKAVRMAANLRLARYDKVVLLHHLTTSWGVTKYRTLAHATGARVIAGLDNGRGTFLTHRALDRGFGYKHESQYMYDVARAAGGAATSTIPRYTSGNPSLSFDLPERYVAVAPSAGAYAEARIWPQIRFVELAASLVQHRHSIVIVGGADAHAAGQAIVERTGPSHSLNLSGQTTVEQLAEVLRRSTAVIGNDSFPAHLGAAVGTPVVAIFGPSNSIAWQPAGNRTNVISANLPCSPCLYTGYRLGRPEGCPSRTCLALITPEMVLNATLELVRAEL